MKVAVLCYLTRYSTHLRKNLICLARKKQKIGAGLWNGYGGHIENGETPTDAVRRELCEEGEVELESWYEAALVTYFERRASVQYRDLSNYEPQFQVHTFVGAALYGKEPKETEEMGEPRWFEFEEIPYTEMLPADRITLPIILAIISTRFFFEADAYYGPDKKVVEWVAIRPFVEITPLQ